MFLGGKSMVEYYKLLKEDLGTYASSYEAVHQWVNAIKNGQQEKDDTTFGLQPQYWQTMNAT
jgi:hypothetical protein